MSFRTIVTLAVILAIGLTNSLPATAQSSATSVKAEVERRIKASKEKVVVEMANGSKVSGKLVSSAEDGFVLTEEETKQSQTIAFSDVKRVRGRGLGKTAKIAIGVSAAAAITLVVLGIAFRNATRNN